MYGLGMGGDEPQDKPPEQQSATAVPADRDAAKEQFNKWWSGVPAELQAPLVYAFMVASKPDSIHQDDPAWVGLTVEKLEAARKAAPQEWVDVIEAAKQKDEGAGSVAVRLYAFGQAWLAEKAKTPAPAAKPAADVPVLLWVAGAILLGWLLYGRKKGA